jgi:hypothetical protein
MDDPTLAIWGDKPQYPVPAARRPFGDNAATPEEMVSIALHFPADMLPSRFEITSSSSHGQLPLCLLGSVLWERRSDPKGNGVTRIRCFFFDDRFTIAMTAACLADEPPHSCGACLGFEHRQEMILELSEVRDTLGNLAGKGKVPVRAQTSVVSIEKGADLEVCAEEQIRGKADHLREDIAREFPGFFSSRDLDGSQEQLEALGLIDQAPFAFDEVLPHALVIALTGHFLQLFGNAEATTLFQSII